MRSSRKRTRTARELRQNATPAEAVLWERLRAHRLCGFKFRRQFPLGPYSLDFYCPARRLAVEVDGNYHDEPNQIDYDAERTRYLDARGITVLRFANEAVLEQTHQVTTSIQLALTEPEQHTPSPSPN